MTTLVQKITLAQNKQLHALRNIVGLKDDTWRDFLAREANVSSSKDLSEKQAFHVIARLQALTGDKPRPRMDGRFVPKLRALWIAGYNLGVVRDNSDAALMAFITRQTGVSHTRFLFSFDEANKVITALKKMLARDGGVVWQNTKNMSLNAGLIADKRAIVEAQGVKLLRLCITTPPVQAKPTPEGLDRLQSVYGNQLRALLSKGV
jgi:hypothetical protein